jgi:hypothetical protein
LRAHAPEEIANAFAQANLAQPRGSSFGAAAVPGAEKILERALPV